MLVVRDDDQFDSVFDFARKAVDLALAVARIDDDGLVNSVTMAARTLGLSDRLFRSVRCGVRSNCGRNSLSSPCGSFELANLEPGSEGGILLHELAHVKRRDVSTQLLGRLAMLAYWFNPLVWHAVRNCERIGARVRRLRLAGRTGRRASTPKNYFGLCDATVPLGRDCKPMAHSARLDQRVMAILDPQRRRDPVDSHSPSSCRALWASYAVCWAVSR